MPFNNNELFLIGIAVLCVFVTIIIVVYRCNQNIFPNTCSTVCPPVIDPDIDPSVIDPDIDPSVIDPDIDPSVINPDIDPSVIDPNLILEARRRTAYSQRDRNVPNRNNEVISVDELINSSRNQAGRRIPYSQREARNAEERYNNLLDTNPSIRKNLSPDLVRSIISDMIVYNKRHPRMTREEVEYALSTGKFPEPKIGEFNWRSWHKNSRRRYTFS